MFALLVGKASAGFAAERPPRHEVWLQRGVEFADWTAVGALVDAGARIDLRAPLVGRDESGRYHGGEYLAATLTGPANQLAEPFDEAIVSWNAETPPGTWIEARLRALVGDRWTKEYVLGVWSLDPVGALRRQSVADQGDPDGDVDTDTLKLRRPAAGYQVSFTLFSADPTVTPTLRLAAVTVTRRAVQPEPPPAGLAWGIERPVPPRSQLIYPGGGAVWCSPTSTKMVLEYWAGLIGDERLLVSVPEAAARTYDLVYDGNGNWPFNTAYAGAFGLEAYVARFSSLAELEPWIAAGVPVVASYAWRPGELTDAPIRSASGHLSVIRGFDAAGDVIVNDPAAPSDGAVRRVYRRAEFERVWQRSSNGTVYLIYPPGWPVPRLR